VIHNDEASPHMHLNFVPVASGYKRGLEKQVSFDRAITQQDPRLDKTRPFDDWREKEVNLLGEMLKERSIERKIVGTNDYKDVREYKERKDLQREIQ
ncbi:plasmid recombination protein, partial [Xenorhabdus sp. 12]